MDITHACKTIRAWNGLLGGEAASKSAPGGLGEAVAELKRYLEAVRCDGKPIAALTVPDAELATERALAQIMPFVLSAESVEATRARLPKRR